jgi:hypothetical protein
VFWHARQKPRGQMNTLQSSTQNPPQLGTQTATL